MEGPTGQKKKKSGKSILVEKMSGIVVFFGEYTGKEDEVEDGPAFVQHACEDDETEGATYVQQGSKGGDKEGVYFSSFFLLKKKKTTIH